MPSNVPPLVGIDLVVPEELKQRVERRPELALELFHPGELDYAARQVSPHEHLAARFAAKEAVVKALGLDGFDPLDIEIAGGAETTELRLHGEAARRADELAVELAISLSHVAGLAAAVAVARPKSA
jgi:holo-[acyl-carrier protein] synthase